MAEKNIEKTKLHDSLSGGMTGLVLSVFLIGGILGGILGYSYGVTEGENSQQNKPVIQKTIQPQKTLVKVNKLGVNFEQQEELKDLNYAVLDPVSSPDTSEPVMYLTTRKLTETTFNNPRLVAKTEGEPETTSACTVLDAPLGKVAYHSGQAELISSQESQNIRQFEDFYLEYIPADTSKLNCVNQQSETVSVLLTQQQSAAKRMFESAKPL